MEEAAQILEIETFIPLLLQVKLLDQSIKLCCVHFVTKTENVRCHLIVSVAMVTIGSWNLLPQQVCELSQK